MMIKVGILGLAHGHVFSFGGEWIANPDKYGIEITGAWDHDAERLEKEAPRLNAKPFASAEELLGSGIDAVVIASETGYHAELVEKAKARQAKPAPKPAAKAPEGKAKKGKAKA